MVWFYQRNAGFDCSRCDGWCLAKGASWTGDIFLHQFEISNADRALERGSDHNIKACAIFFNESGMLFSLIGNWDYVHCTVYA